MKGKIAVYTMWINTDWNNYIREISFSYDILTVMLFQGILLSVFHSASYTCLIHAGMLCLAREKYFDAACTLYPVCSLNFGLNKSSIDFYGI